MNRTLCTVALLLTAVACNKPEPPPEPQATTQPAPSAATPTKPAEAPAAEAKVMTAGEPETVLPPGELPTEERYEEEATKKLTSANLELELDALESEIGN